MDREAIKAFVARDRAAVATLKRSHSAEQFRQRGTAAGVALARTLWEHARRTQPSWPRPRERAADLAHHIELKRRIDFVADAFTHR